MAKKNGSWVDKYKNENIFAKVILGVNVLVLICFIIFDIQEQRKSLELTLLAKGKSMALTGASVTSYILENAITDKKLSRTDVFDTSYLPIPNTNPQKYHTKYDGFTDIHFQKFEDEYITDPDVAYAVAVDLKGYVPTHNTKYSLPVTGNQESDLQNNRTKRIFSDSVGLAAVQNTQSYLWQIYRRDTGEILWDISAPIIVDGQHWGGFRVGFSLAAIEEELSNATLRILYPAILVVIGLTLATYWVSRLHGQVENTNRILTQQIKLNEFVQARLAEENELLNITLMSMGEGVILIGMNGTVKSVNQGAERVTGYTSQEAVGQSIKNIFCLTDYPTDLQNDHVVDFLLGLNKANIQPTLSQKKGDKVLVSIDLYPLKGKSDISSGYVMICKNITQKYQDEMQTMLSQKMESIGRLASGIAHEINTPIQFIGDNIKYLKLVCSRYEEMLFSFREYLISNKKSLLTIEEMDYLDSQWKKNKIDHYMEETPNAIQESLNGIERVRKIILAIREFSHPSDKGKIISDINHGILTTITISRNEWKYCANIETDLMEELPQVLCHIDEINQVFLNMIVNASQAIQTAIPKNSEEKGTIWITTRAKDDKVIITIRDTGCGIPKTVVNRIFDPFFTTKAVNKGTGQGLALAHNIIVNNHSGKIFVDSQEGKGTKFIIELPVQG